MSYSDEFPLLEGVGLYASDISGDGNCLFHALSDQVCLLFMHHMGKRYTDTKTIIWRFGRRLSNHLNRMARPGVYGDNMEISAFAREYGCDVKIYQRDFAYVVTGGEGGGDGGAEGKGKKVLHIAYHTWEHYSSVRNRDGPHTGPPNVSPVPLTEEGRKEQEKRLANSSYVQPWMVEVVISSLPYLVDSQKIQEVLEEAKGNIDAAVSKLLDAEEGGQEEGEQQQQQEEGEKKEHADKGEDVREKEEVDKTLGEEERIEETEAERADARGSSETQDNVDKANNLAADTNSVKAAKRSAPKIGARASARIRAREDSRSNPGSGPENSGSAAEETRKQQPLHPKKETPRERKARQKAAAKQRKKGNAPSNKEAELEKGTAVITTGIKELYV
ncbi:hypothetical protein B9Z19DRAFT_1103433 [Tuber borchii]|uniref:OTU domain-containing protein n=1 Tax=Tuber borchii TaxID=42251 RepID=A0A2T6ZG77_TUBBO|nr:hypothetical protein B9Z19DRAFT_1103433 [Tuber borchii]